MANPKLRRIPSELIPVGISAADTNPIPIVSAVSGKRICVWRYQLAGGTSVSWKDGTTTIGGTLTTTGIAAAGIQVTTPGIDAPMGIPEWESSTSATINIVAGASGLAGTVWYSIENE